MARGVQPKSTPRRKPRNSGGSPSGVSEPPMLPTRKMKKTKTCVRCFRSPLARDQRADRRHGGTVVPSRLAANVPRPRRARLVLGVPMRLPEMRIPPATTKSASSSTMKGRYSWATRGEQGSAGFLRPVQRREGEGEGEGPGGRDQREAPLPPVGPKQQQQGDRQEQSREGEAEGEGGGPAAGDASWGLAGPGWDATNRPKAERVQRPPGLRLTGPPAPPERAAGSSSGCRPAQGRSWPGRPGSRRAASG